MRIVKDRVADKVEKSFVLDNGLFVEIGTLSFRRIIIEGIVVGNDVESKGLDFEKEAIARYGGAKGIGAFIDKVKELVASRTERMEEISADIASLSRALTNVATRIMDGTVKP